MSDTGEFIQPNQGEGTVEQTGRKDVVLITPDHLIRMLRSDKFQKALSVASIETRQSGLETDFTVDMLEDGNTTIANVRKGSTDSSVDAEIIEEIDGNIHTLDRQADLFGFHFHPDESGIITPSIDDLAHQGKERARSNGVYVDYPYIGIGHVSRKGDVSILVIQSPPYTVGDEALDTYNNEVDNIGSQADMQRLLEETGYKNCVVKLTNRSGRFTLSSESVMALKSHFAPMKVKMATPEEKALGQ